MNDLEYISKYTYNIEQRIWIVYAYTMVTMMMNKQNGISVTITTTTTFAKAD